MTTAPLAGVLVVALEQAVAAPFATRQLADLGARVIKVERPGGGDFARRYDETVHGMSSHFVWLNRSKDSVELDLKEEAGRSALHALVDRADVFIQNLAPGAAERLGLESSELRARNPRLVVCNVSGYGTDGPLRDAKAYDLLIQAEAGLVSITGDAERPAKAGIPVADISAGMYAFSGILAALYARERTGEGAVVDVSLFDSLIEWMGYPLYYAKYGGSAPARSGTDHAAIAPYGIYSAGDGTRVVLSVQNEREWRAFCEVVLEDPALAVDPRFDSVSRRVQHREQLDAAIDVVLKALDGAEFERRLVLARTAFGRYRDLFDVLDHPQLRERGRWSTVDSPVGPLAALMPAITIRGYDPGFAPIPSSGEQTGRVLEEFGLGASMTPATDPEASSAKAGTGAG